MVFHFACLRPDQEVAKSPFSPYAAFQFGQKRSNSDFERNTLLKNVKMT